MKGLKLSLLLVAATAVVAAPIEKRSPVPKNDIVFVEWGKSVSPPSAEETENKNIIFYAWGKDNEGNPPKKPPMHAHKAHRGKDNNGNDIVFVNWGKAAQEKNLKDEDDDDDPKGDIVFVGWGLSAEGESKKEDSDVESDIVFVGWGK